MNYSVNHINVNKSPNPAISGVYIKSKSSNSSIELSERIKYRIL